MQRAVWTGGVNISVVIGGEKKAQILLDKEFEERERWDPSGVLAYKSLKELLRQ